MMQDDCWLQVLLGSPSAWFTVERFDHGAGGLRAAIWRFWSSSSFFALISGMSELETALLQHDE
jgi:hypothetical protein